MILPMALKLRKEHWKDIRIPTRGALNGRTFDSKTAIFSQP